MTRTRNVTTKIKLSAEAKNALRRKGPSDNALLGMLNSFSESDMPCQHVVRWMAHYILESQGYTFEE